MMTTPPATTRADVSLTGSGKPNSLMVFAVLLRVRRATRFERPCDLPDSRSWCTLIPRGGMDGRERKRDTGRAPLGRAPRRRATHLSTRDSAIAEKSTIAHHGPVLGADGDGPAAALGRSTIAENAAIATCEF